MSTGDERPKLGLFSAVSYLIGNVIGSGIFVSPTVILQVRINHVQTANFNMNYRAQVLSEHVYLHGYFVVLSRFLVQYVMLNWVLVFLNLVVIMHILLMLDGMFLS